MEPINVLVVDDSLVIRGMIVSILEKDPEITVIGVAASAADADVILRNNIVDVVTLDIEMPGVSGLDYLPSLARRHIPTIMLSGRTIEGSEENGSALYQGATACFNKANAVRDAQTLIRQIKDAAHKKVRLSAGDAAALAMAAAHEPTAPPLDVAPPEAPEAPSEAQAPGAIADRLVAQHGPGAMRMLHERLGQMALRGDVKHIETWRAIAVRVEQLSASAGRC